MDRRGIPRRVVRLLVLERTLLALLLRTILSLLEQIGGHVDSERRGTKGREHRTVARDCCELRVRLSVNMHRHAAQSDFDTNVGPKYEFKGEKIFGHVDSERRGTKQRRAPHRCGRLLRAVSDFTDNQTY